MTVTDYSVAAVTRALRVLNAFERPPHSFRLSDLAGDLGMTRNLTFRLLRTLESEGMVFRVDDRYVLGPRTRRLGSLALARFARLADKARPILEALSTTTGETVYLCALEGLEAVCIGVVEADSVLRGVLHVGRRLPMHIGGATKALLAALPENVQEPIVARSATLYELEPTQIRDRIEEVRRVGYSLSLDEASPGADAIGVAVRDVDGQPIAGLGLVGPTDRVRYRLEGELRDRVTAAAGAISVSLWPRGVDESAPV